jgi:hypothetical protein
MKIVSLSYDNWEKYRRPLIRFSKRYDKSARQSIYSWIFQLKKHHIEDAGTSIKIALWEGKIIACSVVSHYGSKLSSMLISPKYKQTHLLANLTEATLQDLGVLYRRIRYNDEAGIKLALQAGLVCFSYLEDRDGQVYLWFGGGHWHSDDISEKEA